MNSQPLPRRDLREPAFRKYEPYIARGCSQSYELDPQVEMKFTPATFVARFRDAVLAKKRFHYLSTIIPATFDLANLEAAELENGHVLIKNKTEPIALVHETLPLSEQDVITIMTDIATKKRFNFELAVSGGEELGKVLAWAAKHEEIDCIAIAQNGKAFFYTL